MGLDFTEKFGTVPEPRGLLWGQSRPLKGPAAMAAPSLRAEAAALHQNGREGPIGDTARLIQSPHLRAQELPADRQAQRSAATGRFRDPFENVALSSGFGTMFNGQFTWDAREADPGGPGRVLPMRWIGAL